MHSLCVVVRLHSPNKHMGAGGQPEREQAQEKSPAEVSFPILFYNPATEMHTEAASSCNYSNKECLSGPTGFGSWPYTNTTVTWKKGASVGN